jgi:outer membrane biosynthesis protein TonB
MCREFQLIAVAFVLATLTAANAQAQSSAVTRDRLMFDPTGLQNPNSRKFTPQTAPTTGQSIAPREPATPAPAPATKQSAAPQPPAAPAVKPAAAPKPPARAITARRPAQAETGNRDTATSQRASERPIPREQPNTLGRISVEGATLGYESQTQMKTYDMSDGRRVPGYDNIQRNDSSYFGLSLKMPTFGGSSPSSSSPSSDPPAFQRDHRPY